MTAAIATPQARCIRLAIPATVFLGAVGLSCSPGASPTEFAQALDAGSDSSLPDSAVPVEPLRLVLGTGELEFESLQNGSEVSLAAGIQGGFHFPLSFRLHGEAPERLFMRETTQWAGQAGTTVPSEEPPRDRSIRMRPADEAPHPPVLQLLGLTAFVYQPTCAHGQTVDVHLELRLPVEEGSPSLAPLAQADLQIVLQLQESYRSLDCD